MKKLTITALTLVMAGTLALAQGPNGRRGGGPGGPAPSGPRIAAPGNQDVLTPLKRALEDAGAPELTGAQETQLNLVAESFRNSWERPDREAGRDARRAFEDAVLAGNLAAAQSLAASIADQISSQTEDRLGIQADFKIQVLNILTDAQVDALITRIGTRGLFQLLGSVLRPSRPGPGEEDELE